MASRSHGYGTLPFTALLADMLENVASLAGLEGAGC